MKKQSSTELGQRIKSLRLALGLKQNEMALAIGLSSSYLSGLISGKSIHR